MYMAASLCVIGEVINILINSVLLVVVKKVGIYCRIE